jgi:acyl-CoA thioester hydrolase
MNWTSCRITVRFRDLDALGHVNYSVYLTYLEEAFSALWRGILNRVGRELSATEFGCVVVRSEIDYLDSALLGQELDIKVRVESVGSTSFTTAYEITVVGSDKAIARARTVQVVKFTGDTAMTMPDEIKSALQASAHPV